MSKTGFAFIFLLAFGVMAAATAFGGVDTTEAPLMTKETLRSMLNDPGVTVIDVRLGGDWHKSDDEIAGAVREDPRAVRSWAENYDKEKTYVLYCA